MAIPRPFNHEAFPEGAAAGTKRTITKNERKAVVEQILEFREKGPTRSNAREGLYIH